MAQAVYSAVVKEFGEENWPAMDYVIKHESNYNANATNPSSGACGIFQANPCSKLLRICPTMEVDCQIQWGMGYVRNRYSDPRGAYEFKVANGWY